MRAEGRTLTALVMFAQVGQEGGTPIFNVGYAVPEAYRGQGPAKSTVRAALSELTSGLGSAHIRSIEIEAIIGVDNAVSQRVAAPVFEAAPTQIIDSLSGEPALRYAQTVPCAP